MLQKYLRILMLLLIAFILPATGAAQPRTKIVVGYASMSSVVTTLWVAQEKGFFAKNGLDVQSVFIPGSPTLIASINTGDIHLASTGGTATLGAVVGGLDMKIIAAFANYVQTDLVVRPEIKTPADLKGKRIGVTSIGGTGWMSALLGLEQIGLSPGARQDLAGGVRRPDESSATRLKRERFKARPSPEFSAVGSSGSAIIFWETSRRFRWSARASW